MKRGPILGANKCGKCHAPVKIVRVGARYVPINSDGTPHAPTCPLSPKREPKGLPLEPGIWRWPPR